MRSVGSGFRLLPSGLGTHRAARVPDPAVELILSDYLPIEDIGEAARRDRR
jgi:hypothetical protein